MLYVRLSRAHNRSAFTCGVESLDHYLKRVAREEADRDLGATYVATPDGAAIAGYYTIAPFAVLGGHFPPPPSLTPSRPIPVVLLGKLAVDRSMQGQRFGEALLFQALYDCQRVADVAGGYAVVVDALEAAVAFYTQYGFDRLTDDERHLFLRVTTIRKMGLAPRHPGPPGA